MTNPAERAADDRHRAVLTVGEARALVNTIATLRQEREVARRLALEAIDAIIGHVSAALTAARAQARAEMRERAAISAEQSRCPWLHVGPEGREGWGGARDAIAAAIRALPDEENPDAE